MKMTAKYCRHLTGSKVLWAASALTFFAPNSSAQSTSTDAPRPKLVIVLVLDQFRQEYLSRYDRFFGDKGFRWLQKRGANFVNARYRYGTTYTGPGHACLMSGTYGHTNGIIGNRWWNAGTKRIESMFFDPNAKLLGVEAVPKDDDTSPRNFIGSNLSDQLRLASGLRSKVIALSNKDRAAIMLAGKLGRAYWFHEGAGGLTSSTFYGNELPAWVKAFNVRQSPARSMGQSWTKLLPEAAYLTSRPDNFPAETDFKNLGRAFPHVLSDPTGKPTADFYEAFTATPLANAYQFAAAQAAIENEALGADEYTDILGVSLTATDIAGHAWGPDSHEVQDLIVRLDGQLGDFIESVNRRFKGNEVLWTLTADHGACPLPEYMASLGFEAGRIKKKAIEEAITSTLNTRFGALAAGQKWVLALEDPAIYLNRALIEEKKLSFADVQRTAGEATLTIPGMMAFYTREQLVSGTLPDNQWARAFERSFHAERGGDVLLQTKPFYFWGSYGERDAGSTHGSPYDYDAHVPLILVGAGVQPGRYAMNVEMVDLAPTLATLLGINPPAGNEGRALHEMFAPAVSAR